MSDTAPTFDQEQLEALEVLREGERFLLVGHQRPDGDCVGSQAALARTLAGLGKDVVVLNPDHPGPSFGYLYDGARFEVFSGSVPEHDVCVLLDFNEPSRCGVMGELLVQKDSLKLVVDHHPHEGEAWWDARFVDVTAAATGTLVWRISQELGVEVDRAFAAGIFTSLVSDTGWFRYSNTDAETMRIASHLVELGVQPAELYGHLHQQNAMQEPKGLAWLLGRLEYFADGRLAVVDQPLGDQPSADSDAVLDIVRSVEAVEVVLFVRELEPGLCKLSARSKTDYNVNRLARRFGGGGHVKASGATIRATLQEAKARLVESVLADFDGHLEGVG